jgi:superfamily II DNA/RNA helicase
MIITSYHIPTGSGKTLAFLLPILELLQPEIQSVRLILVPSRELGFKLSKFGKMGTDYKVNAFTGGHSIDTEIKFKQPSCCSNGTQVVLQII